MTLGDLVEQEPTRALRVFMKQGPQPSLLNVTELSAAQKDGLKGNELTLGQGEGMT